MATSYMVRFFSDKKQIYERRTSDPVEAKSVYDQFVDYCRAERIDRGSAVLYDYVPFGWRPLMITSLANGEVEKFDILKTAGGENGNDD